MKLLKFIAIALLGAWFLVGTVYAESEGVSPFFRLYYSPYFKGVVEKSPTDPNGDYRDETADKAYKVEFEIIVFKYVGFSFTRLPYYRTYENSDGEEINEFAEQKSGNITIYATENAHNSFNLFLGTGIGHIDEFRVEVDKVRIGKKDPLYRDYDIRRNFAGVEYTFDRLGVRLEYTQEVAHRITGDGRKATLRQNFQYITFFIPLN